MTLFNNHVTDIQFAFRTNSYLVSCNSDGCVTCDHLSISSVWVFPGLKLHVICEAEPGSPLSRATYDHTGQCLPKSYTKLRMSENS